MPALIAAALPKLSLKRFELLRREPAFQRREVVQAERALLHVLESALSFAAPVEGRARAEEEQALAVLRGAGAGAVSAAQTRELARAAGVAMTTRSANGAFTLLYDSSPLPTSAQGQVGSGGTGDADAAVNECASLRLLLNFVDALCRFFPSRLAMLVAMPSAAEASQVCRPVGFC